MLRSVRSNVFDALDVAVENHAALHPSFRVHAVHARNVVMDDALILRAFERLGQLDRSVATFVLEGEAVVRTGGASLRVSAGHGFTIARKHAFSLRCEAVPVYRTLVFEWGDALASAAPDAPLGSFPLGTIERAQAEQLWTALRGSWRPARMRVRIARHAACLHRHGTGLRPVEPEWLAERVPPRLAQVSAAVDAQLSDLEARPMSIDLESRLGLSSRQLSRLVRALHERYGFNADGWIDVRNRRRLMLATAMLSDPERQVAEVARAVGYTSSQVMARAFASAGLPAPRDVAAAVAALGVDP